MKYIRYDQMVLQSLYIWFVVMIGNTGRILLLIQHYEIKSHEMMCLCDLFREDRLMASTLSDSCTRLDHPLHQIECMVSMLLEIKPGVHVIRCKSWCPRPIIHEGEIISTAFQYRDRVFYPYQVCIYIILKS